MATANKGDEKKSDMPGAGAGMDMLSGGGSTIRGVSQESEVSHYQVGFAVNAMHAQLMRNESPELMKHFVKLKINIYFWSTVAWVCRGDGVLGAKEEAYIKSKAKLWQITDDELVNVLKGGDCVDDLLKAEATLFEQLNTKNSDDVDKDSSVLASKTKAKDYQKMAQCQLVMQSLVASAQDGIARAEITVAYELGERLGLTKEKVKEMVEVIRCEQTIANTMQSFFYKD